MIFAAASLEEAVQELAELFEDRTGLKAGLNLAGSNVLARQIEASNRADVFLSANEDWVDYLEAAGRMLPTSRVTFASNSLVVVVNRSWPGETLELRDLASDRFKYVSVADPRSVPAGRYAREFLENIAVGEVSLWTLLQERLAPAPDVRAALRLAEVEPRVAAIVYQSDAQASSRVRIVHRVPPQMHSSIRYTAASVEGGPNPEAARLFIEFLLTPEAQIVLDKHGFLRGTRTEDAGTYDNRRHPADTSRGFHRYAAGAGASHPGGLPAGTF